MYRVIRGRTCSTEIGASRFVRTDLSHTYSYDNSVQAALVAAGPSALTGGVIRQDSDEPIYPDPPHRRSVVRIIPSEESGYRPGDDDAYVSIRMPVGIELETAAREGICGGRGGSWGAHELGLFHSPYNTALLRVLIDNDNTITQFDGRDTLVIFAERGEAKSILQSWGESFHRGDVVLPDDRYRSILGWLIGAVITGVLIFRFAIHRWGGRTVRFVCVALLVMSLGGLWLRSYRRFYDVCLELPRCEIWISSVAGTTRVGWRAHRPAVLPQLPYDPQGLVGWPWSVGSLVPTTARGLRFGSFRPGEIDTLFNPASFTLKHNRFGLRELIDAPGAVATGFRQFEARNWWWLALSPLLLLPLKARLRMFRRRRRGLCIQCGYDLRASSDRCPECGHFSGLMTRRQTSHG